MDWLFNSRRTALVAIVAFAAGATIAAAISLKRTRPRRYPKSAFSSMDMRPLIMGGSALTYRIGNLVIKIPHCWDEPLMTHDSYKSMQNEVNVYLMLGDHPRIARCLFTGLLKDMVVLEYYPQGNLHDYIRNNPEATLGQKRKWAQQIIEAVQKLHQAGICHSDLRLSQWLLDSEHNARLSDFNGSGFDGNEALGIEPAANRALETTSHHMPRSPGEVSTILFDIFALGSSLFELESGTSPFSGKDDQFITESFEAGVFPNVDHFYLGPVIIGCWRKRFAKAEDIIDQFQGLPDTE